MKTLHIALIVLAVAIPAALYLLYRSPPVPPMRTASYKQIERETAQIQRNGDEAWWKNPILAISAVVACMFIAALVVPEVKK